MAPASPEIVRAVRLSLRTSYDAAWTKYEHLLALGVSNEIARLVLPTAIMSSMYATANLRAWLHFLGLRTSEENAIYKGRPQREIVMAAEKVEQILTDLFPVTLELFNKHGRVAP